MYVIIETAGIELIGVKLESVRLQANRVFDKISEENGDLEFVPDGEITGTVRIVGDDAHCVQMVRVSQIGVVDR